jgi:hypothetical protein
MAFLRQRDLMFRRLTLVPLTFAVVVTPLSLISCGPSPEAGGGIGGTGSVSQSSVSFGPVRKVGSVHVSETQYDNSSVFYCMDGEPCTAEDSLKLGMVVLVTGTVQPSEQEPVKRVAHTITFEESVEGVVQSVAPDGSSLVILGQLITLDQRTVIDEGIPGRSIRNLIPGLNVIEVSGLVVGDGHIRATLLMARTGSPHYEVEGLIKKHDARAKRFEIGELVVDYSKADVSDMTGDGELWNGRLVHVRGDEWQRRSEPPDGATLRAIRVKRMGLQVEESTEAKIEGFITHLTQSQSGSLVINNHPVIVSDATAFENGTAMDLALGKQILLHGALVAGVLEAHEVIFIETLPLSSDLRPLDFTSRTPSLRRKRMGEGS